MKENKKLARHQPHPEKEQYTKNFSPELTGMPDLPVVDWEAIGLKAPVLLNTPATLPTATAVVITWAEAEWAALEHVFCSSGTKMPYSDRNMSSWPGWQECTQDFNKNINPEWTNWGYYLLVQIGSTPVLLFKSSTHLDFPGQPELESLISLLIKYVKPKLILSIGTAGGARTTDPVGTVNVGNAGVLYNKDEPKSKWPEYKTTWKPNWANIGKTGFNKLLFPVPTNNTNLEQLYSQFTSFYKYGNEYPLSELNVDNLDMGAKMPIINNMVEGPKDVPLLTTNTFLVATSDGKYNSYACVEMDDAVIAKVCVEKHTLFGFVRNISDPVQNVALDNSVQGNWGGAVYSAYGMYTSYNGAIAAAAILNAEF